VTSRERHDRARHVSRQLASPAFPQLLSAFPFEDRGGLFGGLLPAVFQEVGDAALAHTPRRKNPWHSMRWPPSSGGLLVEMPEHPQTIGYALTDYARRVWRRGMLDHDEDSYEKTRARFSKATSRWLTPERVGHNITLHWLTNTAASSARLYWETSGHLRGAPAGKSRRTFGPRGLHGVPSEIFQARAVGQRMVYPT